MFFVYRTGYFIISSTFAGLYVINNWKLLPRSWTCVYIVHLDLSEMKYETFKNKNKIDVIDP